MKIDALDRPGGHIIVCLLLILLAGVGMHFSVPKSEDLGMFAMGILGRSMIGTLMTPKAASQPPVPKPEEPA